MRGPYLRCACSRAVRYYGYPSSTALRRGTHTATIPGPSTLPGGAVTFGADYLGLFKYVLCRSQAKSPLIITGFLLFSQYLSAQNSDVSLQNVISITRSHCSVITLCYLSNT